MGIRFDAGYSKEIRDIARNYNKRRNRLIKEGYKNVPRPALVSELKNRYDKRSDLNRELERLKGLKGKDILQKVETAGGVKVNSWEFDYVKANIKNAKEYFQREYERVSKRVAKYPGERQYLDNIQAKINLLGLDYNYMSKSDFRSTITTIDEFAEYPSIQKIRYRGFLSEVDWVMEKVGYDKEKRDKFFKKFSKLTPSQFLYAYDNNDIIGRIYRLYHKNYGEDEAHLTDTTENVDELLDILTEQADTIVKEAQEKVD